MLELIRGGWVVLPNELRVTKILSKNEILTKKEGAMFSTNPHYNLGKFLENIKDEPSKYDIRYKFIK